MINFIEFLLNWVKGLLENRLLLIIVIVTIGLTVNYFTIEQVIKWIDLLLTEASNALE